MVNKRVMGHLHFPDTCSETAYPKTPTFISNLNCKWRSSLGTIGVDTYDPFDSMTWLCSCKNIHSKVDRQTCFMDACVCCAHVCLCVLCVHVRAALEAARLIKSTTHRQGCCRHLHVQWKPVNTRAYYILTGVECTGHNHNTTGRGPGSLCSSVWYRCIYNVSPIFYSTVYDHEPSTTPS